MARWIMSFGPMLWPILLVAAVVCVATVVKAVGLARGRVGELQRGGINAILGWGVVALVLGLLGQFMGLYKGAQALAHARGVRPQLVAMGFGESIQTTILGLLVLLVAMVAWLALGFWHRLREA